MILDTGGAGFVGSNVVRTWLDRSGGPVVNLDKLTCAGDLANLAGRQRDAVRVVAGQVGASNSSVLIARATANVLDIMLTVKDGGARWGLDHLVAADETSSDTYSRQVIKRARQLGIPSKATPDVAGAITTFDVAVDLRRDSPCFDRWACEVRSGECRCLWGIREGFGHGFAGFSDSAEVLDKSMDYRGPEHERGLLGNDLTIDVQWPLTVAALLAVKDAVGLRFDQAEVN